jgi:hypothetical protein
MSGTASVPGWYIEFQAAVLRQLPRPGEIDQESAQGWSHYQGALKIALAHILVLQKAEEQKPATLSSKLKLYLHDTQKGGGVIGGRELEAHLKKTGRIKRCPSKNGDVVLGWLANPTTYPTEYKGKRVFLWGSIERVAFERIVSYLTWENGYVVEHQRFVGDNFDGNDHTLLQY